MPVSQHIYTQGPLYLIGCTLKSTYAINMSCDIYQFVMVHWFGKY
jgi:hypothetical protein